MFTARTLFLIYTLLGLAWDVLAEILETGLRKKPLPEEVADIYSPERYKTFLRYQAEINRYYYPKTMIVFVLDILVIYSGIFAAIESAAGGNVYLISLFTFLFYWALDTIVALPYSYLRTFKVDEAFGQNRMTHKEFFRDYAIDEATETTITGALYMLAVFVCEHMPVWTNGFSVSLKTAALISAGIGLAIWLFVVLSSLLSFFAFRKQYNFTPLPAGELRTKIEALTEGCKKKLSEIYVYDESKKSVEKNAFLLSLLWHREFGIADNYVNESSEAELLAVLAHEAGHLKHKKTAAELARYFLVLPALALLAYLIAEPGVVFRLNDWIRRSFNIEANNYFLLINIYLIMFKPVSAALDLAANRVSRKNEDEADLNAVKCGFGQALIKTFKDTSTDELLDVVKHPLVELVEDDHPSMYHRIIAIKKAMNSFPEGSSGQAEDF